MVLGLPNKVIVLAIVAGALVIPSRLSTAAGVVTEVSTSISSSLTALGSTRIEPVFNPTIGISGNIGSRLVERFLPDDPSGEPVVVETVVTPEEVTEIIETEDPPPKSQTTTVTVTEVIY